MLSIPNPTLTLFFIKRLTGAIQEILEKFIYFSSISFNKKNFRYLN
jgi:hypothetical protein